VTGHTERSEETETEQPIWQEGPNVEGQIVTLKEDEFRVLSGGKAQVKNGKGAPVKVKNMICNPDDGSSN
jgi:hypothetical protein